MRTTGLETTSNMSPYSQISGLTNLATRKARMREVMVLFEEVYFSNIKDKFDFRFLLTSYTVLFLVNGHLVVLHIQFRKDSTMYLCERPIYIRFVVSIQLVVVSIFVICRNSDGQHQSTQVGLLTSISSFCGTYSIVVFLEYYLCVNIFRSKTIYFQLFRLRV